MRKSAIYCAAYRKGIRLIFLNQDVDIVRQRKLNRGDVGLEPERRVIFSL